MATEEKIHIVTAFDAGTQSKASPFLVRQNELGLAKNVDLQYVVGAIAKAQGYTQKGNEIASSLTLLGCGSLNTSDGTDELIAFANKASSGANAYIHNNSTGVWSAQSRSYTANQKFEAKSFLDYLFIVNGLTDSPESYSGSGFSTSDNVSDMPKAKYIEELDDRLYLYNINVAVGGNFPSRVWYCDLPKNNTIAWGFESNTNLATTAASAVITSSGSLFKTRGIKAGDPIFITTGSDAGEYAVLTVDSETQLTLTQNLIYSASSIQFWVGGNYFDTARENSDVGRGLKKFGKILMCYKRFSLWRFTKTADVATDTLEPVRGVPGTTSHRGIINLGRFQYYPADSGIWRYDGVDSKPISSAVQEVWDGVTTANKLLIVGWMVNDRLAKWYVGNVSNSDTGLTINNCVLVHDAIADSWWTESLADTIICETRWVQSDALKHFIFANGKALETELGTDFDSVEIDMEVETPFYYPIAPEVAVNFTRFKVYTKEGRSIEYQYKLAYYSDETGVITDQEWRNPDVLDKTDKEANLRIRETDVKAAGYALKFREVSGLSRPIIYRLSTYYTSPELR